MTAEHKYRPSRMAAMLNTLETAVVTRDRVSRLAVYSQAISVPSVVLHSFGDTLDSPPLAERDPHNPITPPETVLTDSS